MAFVTADRVRDTSTTAGSGSFSVSGTAPTGYRTFSAVLSVNDTFYYSIQHQTLNEWEVGLGTYSSANTFARTTIYSSSTSGSAVTFSAGTKDVFITMAASRSLQLDASGNVTPAFGGGPYTRTTFTATAGQTSFTASYTVGYVQVYVNGILLNSADYTATTGTTVVLASAAAAGDIVDVIALNIGTFSSGGYTRTDYTATAGQTTFTASYTPGYVQVYLNGVMLDITDYTASSGTSIVLGTGAAVGDTVSIVALTVSGFSGNVTSVGTPTSGQLAAWTGATSIQGINSYPVWQSVQTGNFTAVAGRAYPVNTTSGAVTVTLPATPSAGNIIELADYAGTWGTNAVTVSPNGSNINGTTNNLTFNVSRSSITIVYIDSTQGWIASSAFKTTTLGQSYSASYLVVAGGAGGGKSRGGGGGAGGLLSGSATLILNTVYTITVGAGGAGATTNNVVATSGSNSVFGSFATALGGGGGAGTISSFGSVLNGASGGSGGGASGNPPSPGAGGAGGSGTSGQGFAGGKTYSDNFNYTSSGGGGGSSAVGADAGVKQCGAGGAGTSSSITGSAVTYAGGGGGGGDGAGSGNLAGAGGSGGGGAGSVSATAGSDGSANTGGGGGGGGNGTSNGGSGGSGVVILSVPTANYSGVTTGSPTVTTSGSNTILRFTASGSYTA